MMQRIDPLLKANNFVMRLCQCKGILRLHAPQNDALYYKGFFVAEFAKVVIFTL